MAKAELTAEQKEQQKETLLARTKQLLVDYPLCRWVHDSEELVPIEQTEIELVCIQEKDFPLPVVVVKPAASKMKVGALRIWRSDRSDVQSLRESFLGLKGPFFEENLVLRDQPEKGMENISHESFIFSGGKIVGTLGSTEWVLSSGCVSGADGKIREVYYKGLQPEGAVLVPNMWTLGVLEEGKLLPGTHLVFLTGENQEREIHESPENAGASCSVQEILKG